MERDTRRIALIEGTRAGRPLNALTYLSRGVKDRVWIKFRSDPPLPRNEDNHDIACLFHRVTEADLTWGVPARTSSMDAPDVV